MTFMYVAFFWFRMCSKTTRAIGLSGLANYYYTLYNGPQVKIAKIEKGAFSRPHSRPICKMKIQQK